MPDSNPTYRINISLPADWHEAMVREAERDGIPVSEYVRQSVWWRLPAAVRARLSEPRKRGAQK